MGSIRRIYITGGAGAGKTTLAKSLAVRTDFPLFELDTVIRDYEGNGELVAAEVRRSSMSDIAGKPAWIADGSLVGFAQEIWKQADLIVFIESNLRTMLWRIFWRHVKAEWGRSNRHPGWVTLFKFMKVVVSGYRSSCVEDIDGDDETDNSRARLLAKLEQHTDKVLAVNSSRDIHEILRRINAK